MRWWLYDLMMRALQPWVRRKLARRARSEPLYGEHVEQRFGRYAGTAPATDVWIHAVSLGEARAAAILLQALRQQRPGLRFLLTHGTATGMAQGRQLLRDGDVQAWLPWDTRAAVEGFLNHFQPRLGLLLETEVWPNLVLACRARGIDLVLANGRLSEPTLRKARRLNFWARPAYAALGQAWAQTDADAARLARMGVLRPVIMGNLKFDLQVDWAQVEMGHALRDAIQTPVLLLASSREGEEKAWAQALTQHPGPYLPCVVLRHPQRFDAVAALLQAQGWQVLRRSAWPSDPKQLALVCRSPKTVLLGDSMGEMALYYAMARVALMGGSFERHGGQNLIEALACGCPVILGPHTFNFAQASQDALQAGAACRVTDMGQAVALAVSWCTPSGPLELMSSRGLALIDAHRGVAVRMAQAVCHRLDQLDQPDRLDRFT